jgi:hypothetical protein
MAGVYSHIMPGWRDRRTHAGTRIILLAPDLNIRIINAATGELPASSPSTPPRTTSRRAAARTHERNPRKRRHPGP